jgi:hypothetical protein
VIISFYYNNYYKEREFEFFMKVKRNVVELIVPYEGKELTFEYPPLKGSYAVIADQFDDRSLRKSSSSEIASLVYDAFENSKWQFESEIIKILNNDFLFEFAGNLYLPKSKEEINNGVLLETDPFISNGRIVMDKASLVKRLYENDPLVKFIPFGYKIGEQTWQELETNPYMAGRYGLEGAEKMAEIASKYDSNPEIYGYNDVEKEIINLSALGTCYNIFQKLVVNGFSNDGKQDFGSGGYGFGVVQKK